MDRRTFVAGLPALLVGSRLAAETSPEGVSTVCGPVLPADLGVALIHEHVLVDFIGADKVGRDRYDADQAYAAIKPHLEDLKQRGCGTLVECTPAYLGRDPLLLRRLSDATGLHILTNTGYYGAAHDKHLPPAAFEESAEQLAARWTGERRDGIEGSGIRPAFLKIGVDEGPLSTVDRKLVEAAALCHLETGLRIHVHTGDGTAALDVISALGSRQVLPAAYVWVHAQNEKDPVVRRRAAAEGVWIELDGVGEDSLDAHVAAVMDLAHAGHLGQVLVSQDAGWYHVGEPGGGTFRPYTFLFDRFLPALRASGLGEREVRTLMVDNPARALTPGVRKL